MAADGRSGAVIEEFYTALGQDDPQALYEKAPCGYLSALPDGTIIKVNQTFLALTGYQRPDLLGRPFVELLTGGGRIYHETHYAPLLRMQGKVRELALDIVKADGQRLPALINSVLERDESGAPVVIRTAVFDATERRGYEQELLRAKQRAEESEAHARVLARTLQQSLIPPEPPHIPGLDLSASYRPAGRGDEIGGDFYDVFQLGVDDWVVVVGDVRGKGVDAAVVTGLARHTIRATAVARPEPHRVLDALNSVLLRYRTDRFCTVVVVRLRLDVTWRATISCGGHPLPLWLCHDGQLGEAGRPGPLLGVFPEAEFTQTEVELGPGEALVLYTDGVTEARRDREWYGEQRLADAVVASAPAVASASAVEGSGLAEFLMADVLDFQGNMPRDDIVIVAIVVPPSGSFDGAPPVPVDPGSAS